MEPMHSTLSDWSNPDLEPIFLAASTTIEFLFLVAVVAFCRVHCQQTWKWLKKCHVVLPATGIWREDNCEDRLLIEEVRTAQLRMAHRFMNVLAALANGTTALYQSNILRERQRWMPTEFILCLLPISAMATFHLAFPKMVTRQTVNWLYCSGMACGMIALSPIGSPALEMGSLSLSLAYTAFFRLPAVTLATHTSVVIICNLVSFALLLARALSEGFLVENRSAALATAVWVEGLSCVVAVLVWGSLQQALRGAAAHRLHHRQVKAELSAASSLLRLTCDAVLELDPNLRLTKHSPELAAVLLRDRPGASLEGSHLTDFMPAAEAARAKEILARVDEDENKDGATCASAFHTRLVDTCSSRFRTEVFQVRYQQVDGQVRHLIGLRDFTDQQSLARKATDEICEPEVPKPAETAHSPDEERKHDFEDLLTLLEVDLDCMQVSSASSSLAWMAGKDLGEVFSSDSAELFQRARPEVLLLETQRTLKNKTLHFGNLKLRCGDSYHTIAGAMEPMRSTSRLRMALCFQMPASLGFAIKARGTPSSGSSADSCRLNDLSL